MNTIYAPNYTNVFMRKFEGIFIYPNIQSISKFYCGFTDGLFLLTEGSKRELLDFLVS